MSTAFAPQPAVRPVLFEVGPLLRELFAATPLCIFTVSLKAAISQRGKNC